MPTTSGFEYDHAGQRTAYFDGFAVAEQNDVWFHIRPDGSPAYEERFDFVGLFFDGLASARKDGEWFHILPDGSRVD